MSNLGLYQWITSTAKKVGGPKNFLFLVGSVGAAAYKGIEIGVKKGIKVIKKHHPQKPSLITKRPHFSVTTPGKSNEGLEFAIGDTFCVLEADGDSVLIEKIGDKNNPYFVSAEFLRTISDYLG